MPQIALISSSVSVHRMSLQFANLPTSCPSRRWKAYMCRFTDGTRYSGLQIEKESRCRACMQKRGKVSPYDAGRSLIAELADITVNTDQVPTPFPVTLMSRKYDKPFICFLRLYMVPLVTLCFPEQVMASDARSWPGRAKEEPR